MDIVLSIKTNGIQSIKIKHDILTPFKHQYIKIRGLNESRHGLGQSECI